MGIFMFWTLLLMMMVVRHVAKAEEYKLALHHVNAHRSISEKLALAALGTKQRLAAIKTIKTRTKGGDDPYQSKVYSSPNQYQMVLQLGTPPKNFTAIIDTASELVWVQCSPCYSCKSEHRHCSPCSSSVLDPSQSSSFRSISCDAHECKYLPSPSCPTNDNNYYNIHEKACVYKYPYEDMSYTLGEYGTEAITIRSSLGQARTSKINIGCAHRVGGDFDHANGLVGLNLSPNALISQLPFLDGKFSYCLTHYSKDAHSTFFLGKTSASSTNSSQSTSLLDTGSYFYTVHLQSIIVGNTMISRCNASSDLNGEEGTIFDTGSPFTSFSLPVFNAIKDAFVDALPGARVIHGYHNLDQHYDVCFDISKVLNVKVPSMRFNFHGASWQPPPENYVRFEGSKMCLLISSDDGGIIGNIMQQNYLFTFDAKGMKMSFTKLDCSKL